LRLIFAPKPSRNAPVNAVGRNTPAADNGERLHTSSKADLTVTRHHPAADNGERQPPVIQSRPDTGKAGGTVTPSHTCQPDNDQ
jgi:hypothetical protein